LEWFNSLTYRRGGSTRVARWGRPYQLYRTCGKDEEPYAHLRLRPMWWPFTKQSIQTFSH